jgi:hypothetical protein
MNFKQWVIELFKDERGCAPSPELVNAVMLITGIGMGADTLDKFSHKKKDEMEG